MISVQETTPEHLTSAIGAAKPTMLVRDHMAYLQHRPHISALARDENTKLLWCNERFARALNTTPQALVKTSFHDVAGESVVEERVSIMNRVLHTGQPLRYLQVWAGVRSLTHVHPLSESDVFGTRGWFITIEPLVLPAENEDDFKDVPRSKIPHLGPLAILSRRQLEVLRLAAEGLTVDEMAKELHRSDKTVDNHLRELYKHLDTHNRAQVTRFAAEHGILAFGRQEWFDLVSAADLHAANRAKNPHSSDDPA